MKNFIFSIIVLTSSSAFAVGPAPEYLKGGTITVTLKDGKQYTFSADEYAVVKRGTDSPKVMLAEQQKSEKPIEAPAKQQEAHKNIVSVGVIRSTRGFNVSEGPSTVEVTSKKEIGASLQYQRRVTDKVYVGGQVDSNQGVGVNVGLGF